MSQWPDPSEDLDPIPAAIPAGNTVSNGVDGPDLPPPTLVSALRHYRLIALLAVIFAVAGYGYAYSKGNAATAQASIVVQDPNNPSGTDDRYVSNQVKIIGLPSTAQAASRSLQAQGISLPWQSVLTDLSIGSNPNDALISVSFTSGDAVTAQRGANAVVSAYEKSVNDQSQGFARQQQTRLTAALNKVNQQLVGATGTTLTNLQQTQAQLQSQLTQAIATATAASTNVIASSPATLPTVGHSGNRIMYTIVGLVVGALLGLAISYIGLVRRRRITDPHEPAVLLTVPMLSHFPSITRKDAARMRSSLAWPERSAPVEATAVTAASIGVRSGNAVTIAIVGANPSAGSTRLAVNLALLSARQGRRVLLVDGDLVRSNLTRVLRASMPTPREGGGQSDTGLSDLRISPILVQGLSLHHMGVWRRDGGATPPSPVDCRRLFEHLSGHFDVVVIDVPMLESAGAAALVASAQATALVVGARTPVTRIKQVRERLQLMNAHLIGYVYSEIIGLRVDEPPAPSRVTQVDEPVAANESPAAMPS